MHSILSKQTLPLGYSAQPPACLLRPRKQLSTSLIICCEKILLPCLLPPVVLDVFEVVSAAEQKDRRSPREEKLACSGSEALRAV